jgi:anti-sigma regulatory factor (Ser/Thr protein kinase)
MDHAGEIQQGRRGGSGRAVYTVTIPPVLERIGDVRDFVDSIDLDPMLSSDRIFDIKVATSEAAANAIEHARASVRVRLWMLWDRVVVEVANKGRFGPKSQPGDVPGSRGFGLRIMVALADEVTFVACKTEETRVRLTFFFDRTGDWQQEELGYPGRTA